MFKNIVFIKFVAAFIEKHMFPINQTKTTSNCTVEIDLPTLYAASEISTLYVAIDISELYVAIDISALYVALRILTVYVAMDLSTLYVAISISTLSVAIRIPTLYVAIDILTLSLQLIWHYLAFFDGSMRVSSLCPSVSPFIWIRIKKQYINM